MCVHYMVHMSVNCTSQWQTNNPAFVLNVLYTVGLKAAHVLLRHLLAMCTSGRTELPLSCAYFNQHTNAHTSMHAQTRAWSRHTHGETCTQVTWLRKGYVKSINIKRNANGWLSLKVYICLCVFVFVCVDPHLFMSLTVVKIPNILWRSRMKEIPLLN